jgi:DUF4097 and DUF4098 domain-containing protein YvlB
MHRTVVLAMSTAIAISGAALADDWSKTFQISGRPELRVNVNDGSVTIRTWDRKEIEARVTTVRWKIPSDVQVVEHQSGDRVELEVRMPHRMFTLNFGQRMSIQVELRVPREIRTDIRTGDGSITAENLRGETRLSTGDGRIEATSLDGTLDAQTGDGRIIIRGRFDMLNLHTGDGSIEAEVNNGSRITSEWSVRTGDGHVTLRLPATLSADLDVHTGDGHIQSDLPVTVSGSRNEHELRGKLNAGGPPLIVRTNDGSIRLEKM